MGIDRTIYLGPYVRAKDIISDITVSYQGCTKCDNGKTSDQNRNGRYCANCGNKITTCYTQKAQGPSWGDISDEIKEKLHFANNMGCGFGKLNEGFSFWLPNVKINGIFRETHLEDWGGGLVQPLVNPNIIENEINLFDQQFGLELEVLKKYYSEVLVHWGLIIECS